MSLLRTFPQPFKSVAELLRHSVDGLPEARDLTGWNSTHPVFAQLVAETSPLTIIEVGSWKGASAQHFADLAPAANLYCVDTWLGGIDHYLSTAPADDVRRDCHGHPRLYQQFLRNFLHTPEATRIFPIIATSSDGARLLDFHEIQGGLIYIDGSHAYPDAYLDLCAYWPLLAPGGVMFGDDLRAFTAVFASVMRFLEERGLWRYYVEVDGNFWVIRKPKVG